MLAYMAPVCQKTSETISNTQFMSQTDPAYRL